MTTAAPVELFLQVAVAIAAGGLIGLERERRRTEAHAGLRTLALLCGGGPIIVAIADAADLSLLIAIYLLFAGAIGVLVAVIRIREDRTDIGLTTSVTVFIVATIGILIGFELLIEAVAIAIVTTAILVGRERLHGYVDRLSDAELLDSLKLGALVFILYPILPSDPIDPFDILVPQEVLLFAIFVLLIEFTAYVSMRQLGGSRGLAVTGLLAGGANSFATAGVLARTSVRSDGSLHGIAAALMLASVSMVVRNVGIASVLAVALVWALWQPLVVMVVAAIAIAAVQWERHVPRTQIEYGIDSPLTITTAAVFAAMYITILLVTVLAQELFGDPGVFVSAFIGGLVSSAAVAVSAATMFNDGAIGADAAAGMVVLGIAASLTSKIIIIQLVNRRLWRRGALPLAFIGVVGVVTYLLT